MASKFARVRAYLEVRLDGAYDQAQSLTDARLGRTQHKTYAEVAAWTKAQTYAEAMALIDEVVTGRYSGVQRILLEAGERHRARNVAPAGGALTEEGGEA